MIFHYRIYCKKTQSFALHIELKSSKKELKLLNSISDHNYYGREKRDDYCLKGERWKEKKSKHSLYVEILIS